MEKRSIVMKKIIIYICFAAMLLCSSAEAGTYAARSDCGYGRIPSAGMRQTNLVKIPHAVPVNRVILNGSSYDRHIVTPPPPPPKRTTYRYSDFAGTRRFPRRSYYIPSYCLPVTNFNNLNPFCTQYLPYGNSMYLSF